MGLSVVDCVRGSFRFVLTSAPPDCCFRRPDGDSVRHGDVATRGKNRGAPSPVFGNYFPDKHICIFLFLMLFLRKKKKKNQNNNSVDVAFPFSFSFFFFPFYLICNYLCV